MPSFQLTLILVSLTSAVDGATARSERSRSHSLRRHTEQSVVVLEGPTRRSSDVVDEPPAAKPAVTAEEGMLVGSMGSFLQNQEQVMDPKSPKAELRRQMVALIWLERVLQANLDDLDEDKYRDKISKVEANLAKDTSPATAELLGKMRMEMHEFSVPIYQKAAKDELKLLQARQKALLDKIMALDAKEQEEADKDDDDAKAEKKTEQKKSSEEKHHKLNLEKDSFASALISRMQSNVFVLAMALVLMTMVCIVSGIALKVHLHTSRRGTA